MQLASYFDNRFHLGHAAMLVNEGLAMFITEKLASLLGSSLWGRTVGLLGMAFKAESDDVRESLSFKVKKLLEFRGARVLCADPYVAETTPLATLLEQSEALALCAPHDAYRKLEVNVPLVDVWGILDDPELEVWSTGRSTTS
jgi:UDP-N-acetyl-D-mannosaminuronic acid dehydrogenase